MRLAAILMAGAVLLPAGAAMAANACVRPEPPAVLDGAAATMDQLLALKAQVAGFIATSDTYQTCMEKDLAAQRAAAKAARTKFPEETAKAIMSQVDANQADKEKAGAGFNAAVKAYKAAHPA